MDPKTHDPLNKPGAILKIVNGKETLYTKVTPKNQGGTKPCRGIPALGISA